jgi:hypothetical protein
LEDAIQAANSYYDAAGHSIVEAPRDRAFDDTLPARLLATLLVPIRDHDIRRSLSRWLVPDKMNPT